MSVEFKSNAKRISDEIRDSTESPLDSVKSPQPPLYHEIKTPKWTWVKVDLNAELDDKRLKVAFPFGATVLYGRACEGVDYESEGFILDDGTWCYPKEQPPSRPPTPPQDARDRIVSSDQRSNDSEKAKSAFSKLFTGWFKS